MNGLIQFPPEKNPYLISVLYDLPRLEQKHKDHCVTNLEKILADDGSKNDFMDMMQKHPGKMVQLVRDALARRMTPRKGPQVSFTFP